MTKGRSIRLFLADGTPGGIITAEIMNWTGHVIVAPRSRLADLVQRPEASRTGIYILSGADPDGGYKPLVYVGETDNVGKRLAQHNKDDAKEFWEQTCIVTSKDQNLTKAHVKYLESRLISIAIDAGRAKLANSTSPDYGLLPEADLSDMEFFIDQLRTVLPVVGLDFLKSSASEIAARKSGADEAEARNEDAAVPDPILDAIDNSLPDGLAKGTTPRTRPSIYGASSPTFEITDRKSGLTAYAAEIDGEMVILKGSQARIEEGVLSDAVRLRRRELIRTGVLYPDPSHPGLYVFACDTPLSSPSHASSLVFARSDNGRRSWRDYRTNKTYAEWQEEQVAAVTLMGDDE